MSYRYFLPVLMGIVAVSSVAGATDYGMIERTVAKEPVYGSKATTYALPVFGPEAKVRVWVVLDGETVYLDRNADGDLTGKDERFEKSEDCKTIEIADPDGKTRYVITGLDFGSQQRCQEPIVIYCSIGS